MLPMRIITNIVRMPRKRSGVAKKRRRTPCLCSPESDAAAATASAVAAASCCPLAIVYLFACLPLSILSRFARSLCFCSSNNPSTLRSHLPTPNLFNNAERERKHVISMGFVVQGCGISMVWQFEFGVGLKCGSSFCHKIKKMKCIGRHRRVSDRQENVYGDEKSENEEIFVKGNGAERSPSLSISTSRTTETDDAPFEHPFWRKHFECSNLGFWRGLDCNCPITHHQ